MAVKAKLEDGAVEVPGTAEQPTPKLLVPPEADVAFDRASRSAQQGAAALQASVAQVSEGLEKTTTRIKEGVTKAMKTAEQFVAFGQGNLEAFMKSGQIWTQGMQDLGKQAAAAAQSSFEDTVSTVKALAGAKTLKEAIDLQTGYARATLEKTIAQSGKLTETSVKLTEEALAPITARVNLAVEKFAKTF